MIRQTPTPGLASPSPERGGIKGGVDGFSRSRFDTIRARQLRKNPTLAERAMWRIVRRRALGVAFRRQHPVHRFIIDFFAPAVKLAIEIDGGQHATRSAYDASRTAFLTERGISVLRFWNDEVLSNPDGVRSAVIAVIGRLTPSTPTSILPLSGGGGASVEISALRLTLARVAN